MVDQCKEIYQRTTGYTYELLGNYKLGFYVKHFVSDTSVRSATSAPVYQVNAAPTSEWHWSRRDLSPSYNDYGSVGLLQNPTARMMEEGAFAITYSDMEEYRRYTVNLQLLPWLETTAFTLRLCGVPLLRGSPHGRRASFSPVGG